MDFLKKSLEYLLVFWFIITLNFFIPRLMPGDPFTFLSSEEGDVHASYSEEQIEMYKAYYGMDKPLGDQYKDYMVNLCKGNIGYSIYYNKPVGTMLVSRMKWTLGIVSVSIILSSLIGTVIGAISAWNRKNWIDRFIYSGMIILSEIPAFLIALLLLFTLAAQTGLFPLSGGITVFGHYNSIFDKILDIIHHALLPSLTLVISQMGGYYLLARNSMITVISKDYMKTAQAKGLKNTTIIFKHALKNAILPVITRIFLSLGSVMSGAILVENVFNYPGLGRLMREAVMVRDYTLIQGIFLLITVLVLLMNFLADVVYKKIDPRVN